MKELLQMFLAFARIGGLTFGGGYAMLPMLQREVVEKNHWASEEELMNYFAVGQSTPGIIALNVATFIGYKKRGIIGAIFTSLGVVFPSLIIIMAIAMFLSNFLEIKWVQHAFAAIRVCVTVLIFNAVCKLWKGSVADKQTGKLDLFALIIFLLVFVLNVVFDTSPVILVLVAGVLGVAFSVIKARMLGKGEK